MISALFVAGGVGVGVGVCFVVVLEVAVVNVLDFVGFGGHGG